MNLYKFLFMLNLSTYKYFYVSCVRNLDISNLNVQNKKDEKRIIRTLLNGKIWIPQTLNLIRKKSL